ncbi:MAG: SPOCS domain-containing protein [Sarcina sp.]
MDDIKEITILENKAVILEKSTNISVATIGDIINYKLVVKNIGQIDVFDVVVEDLLDFNISFVKESLKIEGLNLVNESILTGINVGDLAKNEAITITFDAKVISETKKYIENIAKGSYKFIIESNGQKGIETFQSNCNKVLIEKYELLINKSVDKDKAYLGDILVYTIQIFNTGEVDIFNMLLKDNLPINIEMVEGSFTINGKVNNSILLNEGILLGGLKPNGIIVVTYKGRVNAGSKSGYSINEAFVQYNCKLSDGSFKSDKTKIASVKTEIGIASFKQMSINKEFRVPDCKMDIKEIEEVFVDIDFFDSYIVKVNENISYERQILTENKLIVHGYMRVSVKYTGLCESSSVHFVEWIIPFSNFIMLPNSYVEGTEIEITEDIESIEHDLMCKKCVTVGVNCLLIAIIR